MHYVATFVENVELFLQKKERLFGKHGKGRICSKTGKKEISFPK